MLITALLIALRYQGAFVSFVVVVVVAVVVAVVVVVVDDVVVVVVVNSLHLSSPNE